MTVTLKGQTLPAAIGNDGVTINWEVEAFQVESWKDDINFTFIGRGTELDA